MKTKDVAKLQEHVALLRAALSSMMVGEEKMASLLFGHLPDNSTATLTVQLGALRAARRALAETR
jgi:hypothetical protein